AQLIPIAKKYGAWVHIDGAFGLFARASRSKRYLTEGIELADSWATDGHKWLNVPFDNGIAIVRDKEAHKNAFTVTASYISSESGARDQMDWNPEWSRRARGIPVYAALCELGQEGVEELVDRSCRHCDQMVTRIGKMPHTEILWQPPLNQGLVRFLDPNRNATEAMHDQRTDELILEINKTGEAYFSGTTWRGKRAMRVSVVNWRTTEQDVDRTIAAISKAVNRFVDAQ
ncbi:MAG: pyridoxal-dependent decarboxylase, partial [Proteobacteria bacterium]|nr:pyridoxal-dependent decarboxylase [Pseudomonadota bacterium]